MNKRDIETFIKGIDAVVETLTSFKRQLTELSQPHFSPQFDHVEVAMFIFEAMGFSKTDEIKKPEEFMASKAWETKVLDPAVEILTKIYQDEPGFLQPVSSRSSPKDCFKKKLSHYLGRNIFHSSYLLDPETDKLRIDFRYRNNGKDYLWWAISQSKTLQPLSNK